MSPPEDLYPPVTQSSGWTIAAFVTLAVVASWWIGLWWRTRRPPGPARWSPLHGAALRARRERCLADIDAVAARAHAGGGSARDVSQHLSPLVRRFVFDATGLPAHTMTLSDLEHDAPDALTEVVAWLYPAEFAAVVDDDATAALERARHFVTTWSPGPTGPSAVAR